MEKQRQKQLEQQQKQMKEKEQEKLILSQMVQKETAKQIMEAKSNGNFEPISSDDENKHNNIIDTNF